MDDLSAIGLYFQRKFASWTRVEGSVARYVRRLGRNGLVAEFRSDEDFDAVRRYLHRTSDVQYVHDAGYSELKTKVRESLVGQPGTPCGTERRVELIVRAALLAYGVSPFGQRLVRIAGALPRSGLTDPPSR